MRAHLNERAKNELLEIMAVLGEHSTTHVLNKLISKAYKEIVNTQSVNTHICEGKINEQQQRSQH